MPMLREFVICIGHDGVEVEDIPVRATTEAEAVKKLQATLEVFRSPYCIIRVKGEQSITIRRYC